MLLMSAAWHFDRDISGTGEMKIMNVTELKCCFSGPGVKFDYVDTADVTQPLERKNTISISD